MVSFATVSLNWDSLSVLSLVAWRHGGEPRNWSSNHRSSLVAQRLPIPDENSPSVHQINQTRGLDPVHCEIGSPCSPSVYRRFGAGIEALQTDQAPTRKLHWIPSLRSRTISRFASAMELIAILNRCHLVSEILSTNAQSRAYAGSRRRRTFRSAISS